MKFVFPKKVYGWLDPKEGKKLFELAQEKPNFGVVVEIGSYEGKSTICLAQGNKLASQEKVYAVDNFRGDKYVGENPLMFEKFIKNLEEFKLERVVQPIKSDSVAASKKFKKPVRLLFIDASHDYEDVKRDFSAWFPLVAAGGLIVFHDATYFDGIKRFADELRERVDLQYLGAVVSLGIFEKTKR